MIRLPLARRAWPYGLTAACIASAGWLIGPGVGGILSIPLLLIILLFRDPERNVPILSSSAVLSPADGIITSIERIPCETIPDAIRITICLSLFDVHLQRAPFSGTVSAMYHIPGRFLPSTHPDAANQNERMVFHLHSDEGNAEVVCIAGHILRRIFTWARPDDRLLRGQRFAIIKLGSRVDLYLPATSRLNVSIGMRVRAGETDLGSFPDGVE
ncbi:phosphatidylserine decarboxylase [bacterium]|nr:phosphatidylserine decarboxylase [candidate division CSSED10-310 bacterium]